MTVQAEAPDWPGTLSNLILHQPTRRLVPDTATLAADLSDAELWDSMVFAPYAECSYTGVEIDMAANTAGLSASETHTAGVGPGHDGIASPQFEVDHRATSESYDGFEAWSGGAIPVARYVKARLVIDTRLGVMWLSAFTITVAAASVAAVLEAALYTRLSGYAGLTALVGTRIYPNIAPQSVQSPFVTYSRISTTRESAMGADTGLVHVRVQVDCWAAAGPNDDGYADVKAVAAQVRAALQRYDATVGSVVIQDIMLDSEQDLFDAADPVRYHRTSLDFMVHHLE